MISHLWRLGDEVNLTISILVEVSWTPGFGKSTPGVLALNVWKLKSHKELREKPLAQCIFKCLSSCNAETFGFFTIIWNHGWSTIEASHAENHVEAAINPTHLLISTTVEDAECCLQKLHQTTPKGRRWTWHDPCDNGIPRQLLHGNP